LLGFVFGFGFKEADSEDAQEGFEDSGASAWFDLGGHPQTIFLLVGSNSGEEGPDLFLSGFMCLFFQLNFDLCFGFS
jgi:hypothetical protein